MSILAQCVKVFVKHLPVGDEDQAQNPQKACKLMGRIVKSFVALLRDTAGSLLPIAAVGMIVTAMIVGASIDLSRAYKVKNQLQAACDAAVLAGRRTVTTNGYDTASQAAATTYFGANFLDADQDTHGTTFTSSTPDSGSTVDGSASTVMNTAVVRLFGFSTIPLTATCASSMGVGNADVMMVLDTTGSMDETLGSTTRIAALRTAMKNFYTTLQSSTSGTNARIRYGFVPYSTTVNVGQLLYNLNPSYLVDTRTYQSRQFVTSTGSASSASSWTKYNSTAYSTLASCNTALAKSGLTNDSDYSNYGSSSTSNGVTTQAQRKYTYACQAFTSNRNTYYYISYSYTSRNVTSYYLYAPISYDTSKYKAFSTVTTPTGTNGAAVSSTWGGCIEERSTVPATNITYSSATGISPAAALDLDIDGAPTSDDKSKWAPMWPEVTYLRTDSSGRIQYANGYYGYSVISLGYTFCPAKAQLLSEMSQTAFNAYADSLVAEGGTYLDIGMIWGGRLASPTGMFSANVTAAPQNGGEVSRHLIFMTDGEMDTNYMIQQAWGVEYWDRRVTANGYTNDDDYHTSRFRAACDAIKAKGIRIWVIAFTSTLSDDLQYCSSDDSSYSATDASGLNTAFQEIAKQVGELRIVQ
ncbi:TadE/TadG family type IV pilus assembly protein [Novosphingobium sp. 9]|uniref:TadE/TadG family type IV pilus assembly protein n=1 Tax=Novosphingobium sp. 9 TaxID=2025349 RepID=UPI0021B5F6A8|nr:pilus assembly protein [Novosphingobium sp. 9]